MPPGRKRPKVGNRLSPGVRVSFESGKNDGPFLRCTGAHHSSDKLGLVRQSWRCVDRRGGASQLLSLLILHHIPGISRKVSWLAPPHSPFNPSLRIRSVHGDNNCPLGFWVIGPNTMNGIPPKCLTVDQTTRVRPIGGIFFNDFAANHRKIDFIEGQMIGRSLFVRMICDADAFCSDCFHNLVEVHGYHVSSLKNNQSKSICVMRYDTDLLIPIIPHRPEPFR